MVSFDSNQEEEMLGNMESDFIWERSSEIRHDQADWTGGHS